MHDKFQLPSNIHSTINNTFEEIRGILVRERLNWLNDTRYIDGEIELWESLRMYDPQVFPGNIEPPEVPFTITIPKTFQPYEFRDKIDAKFYTLLFDNGFELNGRNQQQSFLDAINERIDWLLEWLKDFKIFLKMDERAYTISTYDLEPPEADPLVTPAELVHGLLTHLKGCFRNEQDYVRAIQLLLNHFNNEILSIERPIEVQGKIKGKLAFALGQVYRKLSNEDISKDYLELLKRLFRIFENENLDNPKLSSTNLHKLCTSKSTN